MIGRTFKIGSVGGIAIEVHPSWFLILGVVSYILAMSVFPNAYDGWSNATYWLVSVSASVLLFVTVLIHELAHAVVAIRHDVPVRRITLFIFGGVSHLGKQPKTAGEEFVIAAAGPAISLLLGLLIGVAWFLIRAANEQLEAMFSYLAIINLLLAAFNILPGFPLDGGRVLRSIAWNRTGSFLKATRIASGVGELFGWGLIGVGVIVLFLGFWVTGIWAIMIGWFLLGVARSEVRSIQMDTILRGLSARDLVNKGFVQVTPGTVIQSVVEQHMLSNGERVAVVANGDSVLGILTITDIGRVPRAQWVTTPAQLIMTPREQVVTIDADSPAIDVVSLLSERGLNQVPVIEDGRMIGLVTQREILSAQLSQKLDR